MHRNVYFLPFILRSRLDEIEGTNKLLKVQRLKFLLERVFLEKDFVIVNSISGFIVLYLEKQWCHDQKLV